MELTIQDLLNICWESRWRHLLFSFPKEAKVIKDADGLIEIITEDGLLWGALDLENKLYWSSEIHGEEITLERV